MCMNEIEFRTQISFIKLFIFEVSANHSGVAFGLSIKPVKNYQILLFLSLSNNGAHPEDQALDSRLNYSTPYLFN